MKRTDPSPNAKRVRIGVYYQPHRFERRASDGAYQALMHVRPTPAQHSSTANNLALAVALVAALAAAVVIAS